jgi:glycerophosphoryl diester phosphodiesterase
MPRSAVAISSLLTLLDVAPAPAPPPRPRLVASQGLRYHAPENTLPAMAAALELRVGFQAPVRRTRDGKLVVVHDAEVGRTTSGRGPIASLTAAEVKKLDAGTWYDREFAGEKVPTLDEALALVKQRRAGALVVLDIQVEAVEGEVARLVARHGLTGQVVCTGLPSRDPAARRRLRDAAPRLGVAAVAARPDELEGALGAPDADWVLLAFVPSAADGVRVHKAGRRLLVFAHVPGYDPDLCARSLEAQADALVTDFPLECRALWRSAERR